MVANRISLSEGKERAASESTVLSRVRKLESNDSRSHEKSHARKTVPSFARLAERSKHQKAESAPDDSRQEKLTESVSSIHPRMSYTRDDVDESKIVKDERIGLSSRESDVIDVPAPAPSVNPYTGPSCQHDIAQRALEPGGTRLLSKSTNMSFQRNFVGQKVDPKGFRGTTHSRRALSESPLRHMRKSDSPSSEARNKSVPYPDMTKFDDKDAEKKHRSSSVPRGFLDDAPASNYGTNAPETLKTSFGLARLHEDHSDGRLKVSSQFADSENAGLPILANHHWNKLHNVSVLNSKTDQMNKLIATNSSRGPGADYGLSQHFPVKESNGTSSTKTSLAAGGLTTLQRHHWDKSNKAAIVHERPYRQNKSKSEEVKSSSKFGNSTLSKHVVDSDVKWPNVQSEANLLNTGRQEFNDEPVLPLGLQNLNAQKYSRNQELSQNLKAASIVIQEDKASSVGTSSSSGKSSLSRRELSTVANRALKLYSVRVDSQPTRSVSSHVDNMLDGKQRSSNATMKMAPVPKNNGGKIANAPFAYGSAARLSERLTRAERFNALKESRHRPRWQNADDSILSNDLLLSPTKKNNHPIFGHTNRDHPVIETHDDFSVAPSDNSCSRRSKQLSKAMQQKADSFAAASPTRRMKTIRKQPEIVNTAPPKKLIPSQSRPLKSSPKKKPAKMNQRKTNDIGAGFSEHLHTTQQRKTNEIGAGLSEYPYATQSSSRYIPQRHAPSHGAEHSQYRSRNEMKESEYPLHDKSGVSSKYDVHDFIENELPTSNHRQSGDRRSFLSQDREHIIHRFDDPSISVAFSSDDDLSNILLPPMLHSPLMDSQGVSNSIHPHVREHVATQCKPREQSYNEGRNATAVPSTYEAYKISETPFSGFFDDGQATVGEDSAQDNTFTGSLNKHDMGQESSDSYGTRPDAFQWLHQKYGTHAPAQAPTVTDAELKSTNLGVFHKTKKVSVFNVARKESANDDDDDIFFGLEEVQTDDDDFPVRAALKSNKDHSSRITSGRLRVSVDRPGDDHIFQQQQRKMHDSLPKVGKIDATPGHSTELFETKVALDMVEKTSTLKNPSKEENLMHSGISVTSDMTSSLLVDKGWKARYRPNPVKTILEESQPVASNEDNATADEESLHDHTKSGTSLFTNLRSAFVKSIQQACKMPDEIPDIAACAVDTKMKCDEKLSEAWVGLGEEEVAVNEDETATAIATETIGQSEMGTAAEDMLNDVERRIWAAWDTRDQNAVVSTPAFFHQDNDLTRVASGSSLSQNINAHSCHQEIRNDAQNRLLQHAEKAVDMFGFRADHMAGTMSTESSISHGPKQKLEGDIPVPWLSTALSFEQRAVLKDFSSNLKNDGVQVMKLSRRNRWQIRYLTVSKEVSRLSSDQDGSKNIEQCPKALLWPKRIVRSQKCSISSIKSGGQGGLHFERLLQIRPVVSNEYYDTNLSKRLKREFPVFAGVAVDFSYEGGGQRQLHLCFRTKIDAEAFVATMHIIREAAERSTTLPNKDRLIESYATESSGTKSFDS